MSSYLSEGCTCLWIAFFFCPSWKCTMHAANFNLAPFLKSSMLCCTTLLLMSFRMKSTIFLGKKLQHDTRTMPPHISKNVKYRWHDVYKTFCFWQQQTKNIFFGEIGFLSFLSVIIILFWLSRVMTDTNCEQMKKKKENLWRGGGGEN